MEQTLAKILSLAYQSQALGKPTWSRALEEFNSQDPAFRAYASAEQTRLYSVRQQCFVSKKGAEFLSFALSQKAP